MKRSLAALGAALLLLAACGDTDDPERRGRRRHARPRSPTTRPSGSCRCPPSATEMLFAIGAGDQVVAADEQSNHPEDVPTTDLSAYEPNVEAITTYDPDLVVLVGSRRARGRPRGSRDRGARRSRGRDPRRHLRPDRASSARSPATPTRRPRSVEEMQADIEELVADRPRARRARSPTTTSSTTPSTPSRPTRSSASSTRSPASRTSPTRPTPTGRPAATRSCRPSTSSTPTPTSSSSPTRSAASRTSTPSAPARASPA